MAENGFRNLIRFGRRRTDDVLDKIDQSADARSRDRIREGLEKRRDDRIEFRADGIPMIVEQPGGTTSRWLVRGRNLSHGGISILHGGFVHPGSVCRLALLTLDGKRDLVKGTVVSIRLLEGSMHEIGIRFDHAIDPDRFVSDDTTGRAAS